MIPGIEPVVGERVGYDEQSRTPATAASAEPIAKVIEMVLLTLIPINCAAPLSSEQARIALPSLLFDVKRVSATMMTTQQRMVNIAM